MKKLLVLSFLTMLLVSCTTKPEFAVPANPSSETVPSSSNVASENSSTPESTPSSTVSNDVLSDSAVSPHYLLNVNTTNDIAFLLHMKYDVAQKYWDEESAKVTMFEEGGPSKFLVELESGVYLKFDQSDKITSIYVDYTKIASRDAVSLIGLNGYETFDSITEKFGKELIYPYNSNIHYGLGDEIIEDVKKEMCSMILSGAMFYRADFDENGAMTTAFIAPQI